MRVAGGWCMGHAAASATHPPSPRTMCCAGRLGTTGGVRRWGMTSTVHEASKGLPPTIATHHVPRGRRLVQERVRRWVHHSSRTHGAAARLPHSPLRLGSTVHSPLRLGSTVHSPLRLGNTAHSPRRLGNTWRTCDVLLYERLELCSPAAPGSQVCHRRAGFGHEQVGEGSRGQSRRTWEVCLRYAGRIGNQDGTHQDGTHQGGDEEGDAHHEVVGWCTQP